MHLQIEWPKSTFFAEVLLLGIHCKLVCLFNKISLTALFDIQVFMYFVNGWMDVKGLNVSKGF